MLTLKCGINTVADVIPESGSFEPSVYIWMALYKIYVILYLGYSPHYVCLCVTEYL